MKKTLISITMLLLAATLLFSGCAAAKQAAIAKNTATLKAYLSSDLADAGAMSALFAKKVTISDTDTKKVYKGNITEYTDSLAALETKFSDVNVLEQTDKYTALTYTMTNAYSEMLGIAPITYESVFYFKGGLITKISYVNGDVSRDAAFSAATEASCGIVLAEDGRTVASVQSDSPASAAGIHAGDIITAIDSLPTDSMSAALKETFYRLRGAQYSLVKLDLARGERAFSVKMQRICGLES